MDQMRRNDVALSSTNLFGHGVHEWGSFSLEWSTRLSIMQQPTCWCPLAPLTSRLYCSDTRYVHVVLRHLACHLCVSACEKNYHRCKPTGVCISWIRLTIVHLHYEENETLIWWRHHHAERIKSKSINH